jgi:hypothetical protein
MASLFTSGKFQALNGSGIVPGARLFTYAAGTLSPLATFTDQGGLFSNENPVVCDANGQASVWLGTSTYRMILKNASDVVIWDVDGISANDLSGSSGSASVGYTQGGLGSVTRTVQERLRDQVSVLDFIPVTEHAAIASGTSTLDVTDYFNAAIAAAALIKVPAGSYFVKRPINMSGRGIAFLYWGKRLVGDGKATTLIYGYTGVYPVIDCTGQNGGGEVSGLQVISDSPGRFGLSASDCASIGLMQGRGSVNNVCNELLLKNLTFHMASIAARNGGAGTIGICNNGCEHVLRDNCEIYANLPLVDHNGLQVSVASSSSIGSQYEAPIAAPISCLVHKNRNLLLVALDSFRAWWSWQAGEVDFDNLYTSTRTNTPGTATPAYLESFYITGSAGNIKINAYQEVSGLFGTTYRMDHRYVTFGAGFYEDIDIVVQRGGREVG